LSERELDVLRLLATDLDGPDIARQLFVSVNMECPRFCGLEIKQAVR